MYKVSQDSRTWNDVLFPAAQDVPIFEIVGWMEVVCEAQYSTKTFSTIILYAAAQTASQNAPLI